jgi:hypothetical protein
METIISNNYLVTYLISFLNIPSTIRLMQTSSTYYGLVTLIPEYQIFQKCKPNAIEIRGLIFMHKMMKHHDGVLIMLI